MRLRNTVGALALGLTAVLATAAPAGAAAPVPVTGHAKFCLTAAAVSALPEGVVLTATAPATLDTSGSTPCVTTPISSGSITVDPLSGSFPLDGSFEFTRSSDGQRLDFTDLNDDLTSRKFTANAAINHGAPGALDLLTYQLLSQNVQVGTNAVDITGPGNMTQMGVDVFNEAFDATPAQAGQALFDLTVHLDF
ncbi:hypothetical protein [Streptomyces sp. NBC_01244]|uniref:hypothetical protein n=1 Tax=Streptomyces sp. NBC_01244 TaxID=2903797 RepID=UPI002E113AEF|nr:hypothetical protein OG247_23230 [Streptomyces sp. NBC_01244]